MRLGEAKKLVENDWKRRLAYSVFGEPHIPGWIRLQHAIRAIEGLPTSEDDIRVLDAGCGRGDVSTYLAERHATWNFLGIDSEQDRVDKATKIGSELGLKNVRYQTGDLCRLPFDSEFDVAVCLDVIEHIEDDVAALASMVRALKPGGYLIISSPSAPQPSHLPTVAWREKKTGFKPSDIGHVREGYSLQLLKERFEKAGAEPVKLRFTYGKFGTLAFDLFFSIGDSSPNPIVFAGMYPIIKTLARLDFVGEPENGAAVLGIARKPFAGAAAGDHQ